MTQIDAGWGDGPSARYETLAAPFRPIFADIRAGAETRDRERILPETEIGWLKAAGPAFNHAGAGGRDQAKLEGGRA